MKSERKIPALSWMETGGAFAILFIATIAAFGASVEYGFLNFDDPYLIVYNLAARAPTWAHIVQAFTTFDPELYIPVTLLSYQFNYLVAGLEHPGFYHFTNLVLHAVNGGLVAYLAYSLLGRKWIALLAGLLFIVHPINTEAAVWLSGRKDLLSTTFYLGALCLYLRYRSETAIAFYLGALGLFVLGLLSKVSVLTLPVAILLLEMILRTRKEFTRQVAYNLLPFIALSGVFAWVASLGKERVLGSSPMLEIALMAGKSTVFYLEKLIVPLKLSPIYSYTKAIDIESPDIFIPWIILILLGIAAIVSLRWTKWILLSFLLFLITLAPSFLNIHKGTQVFFAVDRYAYLPMVWLLLLLAVGLSQLFDRVRTQRFRQIALAALVLWLAGLMYLSFRQTKLWSDDETLFTHVLDLYPASVSARTSLSAVYRQQSRELDEIGVLSEGLKHSRDVAYYTGLGSVAARQGKLTEAETLYSQARIADPKNPEPFFFLGALEEQRNDPERAIGYYKEALKLDSSYIAVYNNLGAIYHDQRQLAEAEEMFRTAIEWNPNFMEALYNLFQILELQKKQEEAYPYLLKAYELNPDSSDILIAVAYRMNEHGDRERALAALRHLLELEPDNVAAKRLWNLIGPKEETSTSSSTSPEERRQERLNNRS